MKKVISIILTVIIIFSMSQVVYAASGDVAGNIYSTDIKACVNGVWVDSYNIGGRTVVIVEDITDQFVYSDKLRTLIINDFAPEHLVSGSNLSVKKSGAPVGKIYETDIKTYFRGKELTGYSLNGKMAVAIEELGWDNTFSDVGGKFIWNEDERTISLEIMYRYTSELHYMLRDKHLNMLITNADGELMADFVPEAITNGSVMGGGILPDNSIIPVTYNNEIIGYRCKFPEMEIVVDENGVYSLEKREHQMSVDYFYIDKIENLISGILPVQATAQDWLTYYEENMYTIIQQFETDTYIFLYMYQPNTHGSNQFLVKVDKENGSTVYYNYSEKFPSVSLYGNKRFDNVKIDEENEKVYLQYDADYVIDLKTDTVSKVEN